MFEHIEPRHIASAVEWAKTTTRGVRSEVKERIASINDAFHDNEDWERVCQRWERIMLGAIQWDMENSEEGLAIHGTMMALIATMFSIGFDAGQQAVVDETVDKLLKAPDGRSS